MRIKQIASSLTFLLSLSMAVVASENDKLNSEEHLPSTGVSFINNRGHEVTYPPEEYKEKFSKHLGFYTDHYRLIYRQMVPTESDKRWNVVFNNTVFNLVLSPIFMAISNYFFGSLKAGCLANFSVFVYIQSMCEYHAVRTPPSQYALSYAYGEVEYTARKTAFQSGFLPVNLVFPSKAGETQFKSFLGQLTNPSTITE